MHWWPFILAIPSGLVILWALANLDLVADAFSLLFLVSIFLLVSWYCGNALAILFGLPHH